MTNSTTFINDLPSVGHKHTHSHLTGLNSALAIVDAFRLASNPILVITTDMRSAVRLADELHFLLSTEQAPIYLFPDWEILPYDHFSPHQDIISERLFTLYQIQQLRKGIVLVSMNTLQHHIAPKDYVTQHSFIIAQGDTIDVNALKTQLIEAGYRGVPQVYEHGEFAIRGSVIDIFPMGSKTPFRLDLFDEEVESIRIFDTESQLSTTKLDNIHLLPAQEFPLTPESIATFRQNWREQFSGNPADSPIYQAISDSHTVAGIEYYLPLFFNQTQSLLDYLPHDSLIVHLNDTYAAANHFTDEMNHRYDQLAHDISRPILSPLHIIFAVNDLFKQLKTHPQIQLHTSSIDQKTDYPTSPLPDLTIHSRADEPFANLKNFLTTTKTRVLICAESAGRREVIMQQLREIQITVEIVDTWEAFLQSTKPICLTIARIDSSLHNPKLGISVIAEAQLYGEQIIQRRRRQAPDPDTLIRNLTELKIGDPVVHIDHGVGRYQGLETITSDDIATEYVTLLYANNDKLFVPVTDLQLISRYTGNEHAPLHNLGSTKWAKAKRIAAERIRDVAAELLDIYARRAAKPGFACQIDNIEYQKFAADFPFEPTPDQQVAIDSVIQDLTKPHPMDRLVCGDVGFGKTEVAMRAAFIAANNNRQVAVLVPTTLLAEQHFQNFQDRFADWPITIAAISRLRTNKQQQTIINDLSAGKIDIIIGTHKLLQSDIKFKQLGLLIIDEEHRFGVRQKEKIKSLRAQVDLLALTATPIPRTLNFAMAGVRDLSIIATPPLRRLAVNTFVHTFQKSLIREAMLREILRGGQVFFLHNDVETLPGMMRKLNDLVPEAKIQFAHGQMREKELENVMSDFYHQRFQVLICTTIIESGIDIPSANTIIINRADRFGLAQLHQLRGRVGRSHHQAYAYLLTPPEDKLTRDAQKRLAAIAQLGDLGAGFILATNDLEIRGAGEILGEAQSGHMSELGFSLYMEMLEAAVNAIKSGKQPALDQPLHTGPIIEVDFATLIPEDYVNDVHLRLTWYKRIANAKDKNELHQLQAELIDCYGSLPSATTQLFLISELKCLATTLQIDKITCHQHTANIFLPEKPGIDVDKLINLIQTQPTQYQFAGSNRFQLQLAQETPTTKVQAIYDCLHSLTPR